MLGPELVWTWERENYQPLLGIDPTWPACKSLSSETIYCSLYDAGARQSILTASSFEYISISDELLLPSFGSV